MGATRTARAEQRAREMATSAGTIDDRNALTRVMMKSALERMFDAERDHHLAASRAAVHATPAPATAVVRDGEPIPPSVRPNRRNGRSPKTVQGDLGPIPLDTPRDRDGTFEPQLIAEHQRRRTGFDDTILALDAKGRTTRDIQDLVKELYGVDVSPTLVSRITADLDREVTGGEPAGWTRCGRSCTGTASWRTGGAVTAGCHRTPCPWPWA